ncbi:hypothetical protein D9611_001024 [Ephemerocybe angulata]|uniref:Uncharacterized protein n=1 Tax=Ephemerocybe angulata TaxID=980116 RepID=A0A8H5F7X2_9AGAR|nr:hypothetical protein D9611_001024 [Tulosesus angulatus]
MAFAQLSVEKEHHNRRRRRQTKKIADRRGGASNDWFGCGSVINVETNVVSVGDKERKHSEEQL